MKFINLTKNHKTVVDDEDFERVSSVSWYSTKGRYTYYAARTATLNCKYTRLHRMILNAPDNVKVDHINGNGLDNRKINLRLCNSSENVCNSKKELTIAPEQKGFIIKKTHKKWAAYICKNYKRYFLGHYDSLEEASRAYEEAAKEIHGEFSKI